MDAAPMVARCLELQSDDIPAPFIPSGPFEYLPREMVLTATYSEWCDRCGCDHGAAAASPANTIRAGD